MRGTPGGWRGLARALGDLCFPPACPACGGALEGEGVFCGGCAEAVTPLGAACPRCGGPGGERGCACAARPLGFDAAWSLARHGGPLGRAVRELKYRRRLDLARPLGRLLAAGAPRRLLEGADLWTPVPLHPWRLCWRGFNQALALGRGLSARGGPVCVPDLLRRRRHTRPQVGLSPAQRAANVAGAFAVRPGLARRVEGKAVLLLDDVFTTGATVNECAAALKRAGAAQVVVLTLARAGRGHGGLAEAARERA